MSYIYSELQVFFHCWPSILTSHLLFRLFTIFKHLADSTKAAEAEAIWLGSVGQSIVEDRIVELTSLFTILPLYCCTFESFDSSTTTLS